MASLRCRNSTRGWVQPKVALDFEFEYSQMNLQNSTAGRSRESVELSRFCSSAREIGNEDYEDGSDLDVGGAE